MRFNIHYKFIYRISCPNKNTYIQDCDDDGETKAGSGLLHLLQVLKKLSCKLSLLKFHVLMPMNVCLF